DAVHLLPGEDPRGCFADPRRYLLRAAVARDLLRDPVEELGYLDEGLTSPEQPLIGLIPAAVEATDRLDPGGKDWRAWVDDAGSRLRVVRRLPHRRSGF